MSFPTTTWGNNYDVYTTIPGPTASTPGSSDGPQLGNFSLLADYSVIQFLQFVGATNPANSAMEWSVASTYTITPTTAVGNLCIAFNDLAGGYAANNNTATSGAAVTQNYCAWAKRKGLGFVLVAASVNAGLVVAPSATGGVLYAATAAVDIQANMVNTVNVGGAQAVSPVFIN